MLNFAFHNNEIYFICLLLRILFCTVVNIIINIKILFYNECKFQNKKYFLMTKKKLPNNVIILKFLV